MITDIKPATDADIKDMWIDMSHSTGATIKSLWLRIEADRQEIAALKAENAKFRTALREIAYLADAATAFRGGGTI